MNLTHAEGISPRLLAIVAGVSLLVMALCAAYSYGFVHSSLFVAGDAAATIDNLTNSRLLFRSGIFGWLVIMICDVLVAWALYLFLEKVNRGLSLLAGWLRIIYTAVLGIAVLNLVGVQLLTENASLSPASSPEQLQALVVMLLNSFEGVWSLGLIIFGIHLLVLGYLVYRSGYIPRILGILLVIAAISYFAVHSAKLLLPGSESLIATTETILSVPMAIGELAFCFWLLIKGGKAPQG